jgi:DNA-binding MarR family transcriptional regulator
MEHCENHKGVEAVGYCHGCGTFGCGGCLPGRDDEGRRYCAPCSAARGLLPAEAAEPVRPENLRKRYVVRYKDGRRLRGTFYAMDLAADGFKFVAVAARANAPSEHVHVLFRDLKAVFQVREFRGNRRHPPRYLAPDPKDPNEVAVYFSDGEVIRGRVTGHYGSHDPRFYLTPRDPDDNNVLIVVESSAVDRVEGRGQRQTRELRDLVENPVRKRLLLYYWEHRGKAVELPEIARQIDRVESAVAEALGPFIDRGLIERRTEEGREVLALKSPTDRATRELLRAYYEEIRHLYFRREVARPAVGP